MKKPFDIKLRSFEFALSIVKFCKQVQSEKREFILTKQLIRSGTSVGANIREAKNAESDKDFIHKMAIAQKECDESIYWLELIKASEGLDKEAVLDDLINEGSELLTIILNKKRNMKN